MTSTSVEYNSQFANDEESVDNVWSSCNFEIRGLQNRAKPPQNRTNVTKFLEEPWWSEIPPVIAQHSTLYPPRCELFSPWHVAQPSHTTHPRQSSSSPHPMSSLQLPHLQSPLLLPVDSLQPPLTPRVTCQRCRLPLNPSQRPSPLHRLSPVSSPPTLTPWPLHRLVPCTHLLLRGLCHHHASKLSMVMWQPPPTDPTPCTNSHCRQSMMLLQVHFPVNCLHTMWIKIHKFSHTLHIGKQTGILVETLTMGAM